MPYCHPCDRYFSDFRGYQQHINNSSAHFGGYEPDPEFECDGCERSFSSEHAKHQHSQSYHSDRYCVPCKRMFMNSNNLTQHHHSKLHQGSSLACPFCKICYPTASAVTIHLESGTCRVSSLNRRTINTIVQQLDRRHVITRPMITLPNYDNTGFFATSAAWNGHDYQCYLCAKTFQTLQALNSHIKSPAHEQPFYRCPKASCGKNFKLLSGLVQHVESESCGLMRFNIVQQQARGGITNMVGRMIAG